MHRKKIKIVLAASLLVIFTLSGCCAKCTGSYCKTADEKAQKE